MTKEECIEAMEKKLPIYIEGSYRFFDTPTIIISVGWMSCKVENSDDHYEHYRIKLAKINN